MARGERPDGGQNVGLKIATGAEPGIDLGKDDQARMDRIDRPTRRLSKRLVEIIVIDRSLSRSLAPGSGGGPFMEGIVIKGDVRRCLTQMGQGVPHGWGRGCLA